MILAFHIADIIQVPFGYLLEFLYQITNNYGWALILFAVIVQMVLLPITAKSKRSMMKMSRLTPEIQRIQQRYPDDQTKQSQAMQELYKQEGVSMGGGCLWSLVPMLILLPLYTVVRQPLTYMLHESAENVTQIVNIIRQAAPDLFSNNVYYDQMIAAQNIPQFAEAIKAAIPDISQRTLAGIDPNFFGINMASIPQFNIFGAAWAWDWAHIGAFLVALLSTVNQVVSMLVSQKTNNSVVTNEDGLQDKEAVEKSQANQTNKIMMWMMPLMMLWIGFTVPCALSVYWFAGGVVRTIQDALLTVHYRKIYDAEDAERLKRRLEQDRLEEEKERIRAQRRAANPDGITENTSKKKLQKQQRDQEQQAREAAEKEYALRKGKPIQEEAPVSLSGVSDRPYCKGRAYDPNRYASNHSED